MRECGFEANPGIDGQREARQALHLGASDVPDLSTKHSSDQTLWTCPLSLAWGSGQVDLETIQGLIAAFPGNLLQAT